MFEPNPSPEATTVNETIPLYPDFPPLPKINPDIFTQLATYDQAQESISNQPSVPVNLKDGQPHDLQTWMTELLYGKNGYYSLSKPFGSIKEFSTMVDHLDYVGAIMELLNQVSHQDHPLKVVSVGSGQFDFEHYYFSYLNYKDLGQRWQRSTIVSIELSYASTKKRMQELQAVFTLAQANPLLAKEANLDYPFNQLINASATQLPLKSNSADILFSCELLDALIPAIIQRDKRSGNFTKIGAIWHENQQIFHPVTQPLSPQLIPFAQTRYDFIQNSNRYQLQETDGQERFTLNLDEIRFLQQAQRVIRPDGLHCIADYTAQQKDSRFLNTIHFQLNGDWQKSTVDLLQSIPLYTKNDGRDITGDLDIPWVIALSKMLGLELIHHSTIEDLYQQFESKIPEDVYHDSPHTPFTSNHRVLLFRKN